MELCVVLTSRGNYAKFKRIIQLAGPKLIIGGELLLKNRVTSYFDLQPDKRVYFNVQGDSLGVMGKSLGLAINEFTSAFEELKPDYVMLVGDRFETFAAATAAYVSNIPIVHLEGGEVSGSLDNRFRYAISEFASIHFPCTYKAKENLSRFSNVYVTGCTSLDSMERDLTGFETVQHESGSGTLLDTAMPYLVVIYHPDTSHYETVADEINSLIDAVDSLKMPTFWLNANMDAGSDTVSHALRVYRDTKKPDFIHFFKSLPIEYYGPLLANASCIVGNSSSGIREAGFLGTPNVTIGKRQQDRELCKNTLRSFNGDIAETVRFQLEHGRYSPDYTYGDGTASEQIMEIMEGIICAEDAV